jgi:propanol-preferring alcohol dehydrogenase
MPAAKESLSAVLSAPGGPIEVKPVEVEEPGGGEVLVRMEACGVCHSDLLVAGLQKLPVVPLVLGHEGIGRVEAVGEAVTEFSEGDRVGMTYLASTCGECDFCRSGRERFCPSQSNLQYTRNGALARYALAPVQYLARIPDGVPPEQAAPLCCAGWTAYATIRETGLQAGQTVALFGMGGLGHLGLQYALHRGLRVAAVDVSDSKLDLARQLGAEIVLSSEDAGRVLLKAHGGVDAAVVFTASTAAVQEAFRSLRRGGTLVVVGLSTVRAELPVFETILKGITIRGSYLGSRPDLDEVFRLAAAGVGKPHVETHQLIETPELLERLRRGGLLGRAVVVF